MKYKRVIAGVCLLAMIIASVGCGSDKQGTVTGTNYYYPEAETEENYTETAEVLTEAVKAELGSEYYMIMRMDMTMEHMILKQIASGKQYLYYYSLTTKFMDKYGNHISAGYFEPGRIITIGEKDTEGRLKEAQIADVVWEYEDIVRFDIDEEREVFRIADTKYTYDEDLYVVSGGNEIELSDIKAEDELRVVGMNKEILSVSVTTGQGTISIKNTELFEDSFIQIGSKIFAEITGEMELEVPEGTYMVTVANKGYGGTKEYEVKRDLVTVIDLDELKGEGPKKGAILFEIETTDVNEDVEITFKIDGKEVTYDEPISLTYGIHGIEAEAFGYETYAKKLFVNSESATISIALDTEKSSAATTGTEKEETNQSTDLAGSLAGSTSNSGANNSDSSSKTDALIESLTEALQDDSSKDYISTLTELLGSVLY